MSRIKSFANKETEKVYQQQYSLRMPIKMQRIVLRKLIMLDNAQSLNDLRVPPANRLEALKGDREGYYSIRINDKYRICFRVENGYYYDVEIVDYH